MELAVNTLYGVLLEHGKRAFVALIVVVEGGREVWRAFGTGVGGWAGGRIERQH
jgi:hypothetical protein